MSSSHDTSSSHGMSSSHDMSKKHQKALKKRRRRVITENAKTLIFMGKHESSQRFFGKKPVMKTRWANLPKDTKIHQPITGNFHWNAFGMHRTRDCPACEKSQKHSFSWGKMRFRGKRNAGQFLVQWSSNAFQWKVPVIGWCIFGSFLISPIVSLGVAFFRKNRCEDSCSPTNMSILAFSVKTWFCVIVNEFCCCFWCFADHFLMMFSLHVMIRGRRLHAYSMERPCVKFQKTFIFLGKMSFFSQTRLWKSHGRWVQNALGKHQRGTGTQQKVIRETWKEHEQNMKFDEKRGVVDSSLKTQKHSYFLRNSESSWEPPLPRGAPS